MFWADLDENERLKYHPFGPSADDWNHWFAVATVNIDGNAPQSGESLFIVRQLNWVRTRRGYWSRRRDHAGRFDFGRPVRAFADRHEADAFRTQAERRDRAENPFAFGPSDGDPLAGRTSLAYPLLHDWLLDCGAADVPGPDATTWDWRDWWEGTEPDMSPLQRAKAWEAFDRVRLYDVAEVPWDDGT
jgi:hypothetical protein